MLQSGADESCASDHLTVKITKCSSHKNYQGREKKQQKRKGAIQTSSISQIFSEGRGFKSKTPAGRKEANASPSEVI